MSEISKTMRQVNLKVNLDNKGLANPLNNDYSSMIVHLSLILPVRGKKRYNYL